MIFHGIGVTDIAGRGRVAWGPKSEDYDAVGFLTFFLLPLIPFRFAHVSTGRPAGRDGETTQYHPIRFSVGLLIRAYLMRWTWALILLGALLWWPSFQGLRPGRFRMAVIGTILIFLFFAIRWLVDFFDRRNRRIRWVLGRHYFGSSDPVDWPASRFAGGSNPESIYGTATYAEAVPDLLAAGDYSRAMWAARMTTAVEDRRTGEHLTNEILRDAELQLAIVQVEANPDCWDQVMV